MVSVTKRHIEELSTSLSILIESGCTIKHITAVDNAIMLAASRKTSDPIEFSNEEVKQIRSNLDVLLKESCPSDQKVRLRKILELFK